MIDSKNADQIKNKTINMYIQNVAEFSIHLKNDKE